MSKIEAVVTITGDPGEHLNDLFVKAVAYLIRPDVDKVIVKHNHKYTITKEKICFVG